MKMKSVTLGLVTGTALLSLATFASAATVDSPTSKGTLPAAVSSVGGIVLDMVGVNGARVVSQLAASTLYIGYAGSNPQVIGTQTGLGAAVVAALGGGLAEVAVRISLWDGDTAAFDFDDSDNTLLLNGLAFGDFSDVPTTLTDGLGNVSGSSTGFPNNLLATGFFYSTDATLLANLYTSIGASGEVAFALNDVDPYDNYYDFKQGIDSSLVNVGTGPVVTPPSAVPLPASFPALIAGLGALAAVARRRKAA